MSAQVRDQVAIQTRGQVAILESVARTRGDLLVVAACRILRESADPTLVDPTLVDRAQACCVQAWREYGLVTEATLTLDQVAQLRLDLAQELHGGSLLRTARPLDVVRLEYDLCEVALGRVCNVRRTRGRRRAARERVAQIWNQRAQRGKAG